MIYLNPSSTRLPLFSLSPGLSCFLSGFWLCSARSVSCQPAHCGEKSASQTPQRWKDKTEQTHEEASMCVRSLYFCSDDKMSQQSWKGYLSYWFQCFHRLVWKKQTWFALYSLGLVSGSYFCSCPGSGGFDFFVCFGFLSGFIVKDLFWVENHSSVSSLETQIRSQFEVNAISCEVESEFLLFP